MVCVYLISREKYRQESSATSSMCQTGLPYRRATMGPWG